MSLRPSTLERLKLLRVSSLVILLAMLPLVIASCGRNKAEVPQVPTLTPVTREPDADVTTPEPIQEQTTIGGSQPIPGGPVLLRNDISLRKVVDVGAANIRLDRNPLNNTLYYLHPTNGLFQVTLSEPSSITKASDISDINADGYPAGMAFGPDGTLYIVVNRMTSQILTQGLIYKGIVVEDGEFAWDIVARSEPYPTSATPFDHLFNGIVVSPDNQWIFINSGSRTDHGEVQDNSGSFPDTRGVPLTARIFRIPTDAVGITIPNNESAQIEQGLLFASGTRNAFDLAFAPNGDLFAIDNGPDADFPDELNWIREGEHYGFPWRFGTQDNPQQFADYDASNDKRLSGDFTAVQLGTYQNDPGFPPAPGSFSDPVVNLGPAAAQYRGEDGRQYDAGAEGKLLHTFTPHRSPLGLVFITNEKMPSELIGSNDSLSAFILSWGAAGGTLSDSGQDLLHLDLNKQGNNYESITTQIATDFKNPIDAVMIENKLYVLEYGSEGAIWELEFE